MSGRFNRTGVTTQQLLEIFSDNGCNFSATHRKARELGYDISMTAIKNRLHPIIGTNENNPDPDDIRRKLEFARKFSAKLDAAGIDPSCVNLDRMVVKQWQGFYKDGDDQGQTVDLEGVTFYASPQFADGPLWQPVQPCEDKIVIKHRKAPDRRASDRVAVVRTDPQIGYLLELGVDFDPETFAASLTPFHDEAAIDVSNQLLAHIQPTRLIEGGDTIDFPEHTRKFRRFPEYARTTNFALSRGKRYIAEASANAGPQCEIDLCDGNHDAREANDTLDNQMAGYGLRRALVPGEAPHDSWPNNSLPSLLRLEHLQAQGVKINYSAPYPAGRIWLTDYIQFRHDYSFKVREQVATILHGHDHKLACNWRTIDLRGERVNVAEVSCGSLCRNDLMVFDKYRRMPSYVPSGRFEQDWQQGIVVVYYDENGGPNDYEIQTVRIKNGVARFNGKKFEARCTVDGKPL